MLERSYGKLCIADFEVTVIPAKWMDYYKSGIESRVKHAEKYIKRKQFVRHSIVLTDTLGDFKSNEYAFQFVRNRMPEVKLGPKDHIFIKVKNIYTVSNTTYKL